MALRHLRTSLLGLAMLSAGNRYPASDGSPFDVAIKSDVRVRTLERTGPRFLASHGGNLVTSLSLMQNAFATTVGCSDGEVLSGKGFLAVDARSNLVVLRLSDLSDCPLTRIAGEVGDQVQRMWAFSLPDSSRDLPCESQVSALLLWNDGVMTSAVHGWPRSSVSFPARRPSSMTSRRVGPCLKSVFQ